MTADILLGDCLSVLRDLPAGSVQCCVTSPPYYGLRDYGVPGQIGLEETPEAYIEKLVAVFREVRRVLADDGTLWLNLGDSYWGGKGQSAYAWSTEHQDRETLQKSYHQITGRGETRPTDGKHDIYKPKDLLMIPARVALALQADGWYLRSEIIWHKPNPMPESVRDRPTKAHEMIYLLAKSQKYFYDAEAVAEPSVGTEYDKTKRQAGRMVGSRYLTEGTGQTAVGASLGKGTITRNRRDVWTVTTKPYKEAHFATFPPDLIEPCILAGTSERGQCPKCGRAWVRVVEHANDGTRENGSERALAMGHSATGPTAVMRAGEARTAVTTGWRPSCACVDESDHNGPFEPVPQTVLDPFNGSGTTGAVSVMHGRNYIGIELNPAYIELTERRINGTQVKAAI